MTGTTDYYGYARLEKVQATMKLTFKPRVNIEKREVTVEIQPDISDVAGKGAQGYPVVTVRRAKTKMGVYHRQALDEWTSHRPARAWSVRCFHPVQWL